MAANKVQKTHSSKRKRINGARIVPLWKACPAQSQAHGPVPAIPERQGVWQENSKLKVIFSFIWSSVILSYMWLSTATKIKQCSIFSVHLTMLCICVIPAHIVIASNAPHYCLGEVCRCFYLIVVDLTVGIFIPGSPFPLLQAPSAWVSLLLQLKPLP